MYDEEGSALVPKLMEKAVKNKVTVHLPVDFVTADKFDEKAGVGSSSVSAGIPKGWMGLDIGVQSIVKFTPPIQAAKTILWNG